MTGPTVSDESSFEQLRQAFPTPGRFTAVGCPDLLRMARKHLPSPVGDDSDLYRFVGFAIVFADSQEPADDEQSFQERRYRAAGGAYLFAIDKPRHDDKRLLYIGNGRKADEHFWKPSDENRTWYRNTWAFHIYKRAIDPTDRTPYHGKSGANLRSAFAEAVVNAVREAVRRGDEFRAFVIDAERDERAGLGADYVRGSTLLASTEVGRVDRAEYVSGSPPEYTPVPIGVTFPVTWTIRNSGKVPWYGRKLVRQTSYGPTVPDSPREIPVPDTRPGETVTFTPDFVAGRVQSEASVFYKMAFDDGRLCWPDEYFYGLSHTARTIADMRLISRTPDTD